MAELVLGCFGTAPQSGLLGNQGGSIGASQGTSYPAPSSVLNVSPSDDGYIGPGGLMPSVIHNSKKNLTSLHPLNIMVWFLIYTNTRHSLGRVACLVYTNIIAEHRREGRNT